MREGWELKPLNEVCQIRPPKREAKEVLDENDFVSFVPMKILGEDEKSFNAIEDKKLSEVTSSYTYFKNNDVLLAKITPCFENGKLGIAKNLTNEIGFGSSEFIVYRALDSLHPEYLYYFLSQESFRIVGKSQMTGAVGHKRIPKEFYERYKIPVPPLKEQKQIVSTLDKAFKQIDQAKANLEQNLHNAKELFQSKLNEVFSQRGEGWVEKSFDEVCQITSKLIDPKEKEYQDLLHIGAGNIESENGRLHSLKTAKEENLISGKFLFDDEMVLYSKIRPYLMKVVKCDFIGLCSADIYPLVPEKKEITQSFLYYLLLSNNFTEYAIKGSARAGMPKVNRKHLFDYICYLPNIEKQDGFTKMLDILFEESLKLQTHYQQKLNNLEELKKSILQKAFSGEL